MSERARRILELARKSYQNLKESDVEDDPVTSDDSLQDPDFNISSDEEGGTSEFESSEAETTEIHPARVFDESIMPATIYPRESSESSSVHPNCSNGWSDPTEHHQNFEFEGPHGIPPEIAAALVGGTPLDFFSLFLDADIIKEMVEQTNLYATQTLMSTEDVGEHSRLHSWEPTTLGEMKRFIGILGYMGIVDLPTLRHYWCKRRLFGISILSNVMSRNRFEILLKMWHFSNNEECPDGDRGFKIVPLMNSLIGKWKKCFTPGETFCVDETLVPFRGRLKIKQYIPQKTHKYGIKIFKLCADKGYTWNMKMYCGREKDASVSVPTNVVMRLSKDLLNAGRTVVTDNYYTSIELANALLDNQTHLIGTLRSNSRGNPKNVIEKKMKVGEIVAQENNRGICIMKWRDRRDVLLLSTKHKDEMVVTKRHSGSVKKPVAILDYNKGKSSIDLSDQLSSYGSALRKTLKWYRKLAIELILGTSVVNAHFIYKIINDCTMPITVFRELLIDQLLFGEEEAAEGDERGASFKKRRKSYPHSLKKMSGPSHKVRKYCKGCYEKKKRAHK